MSELYYNGTIITMDDAYPQAEAILVEKGRIAKRGTKAEVFECRRKDTICIDLHGKTMLPGFIDGHSHFAGLATSLTQCDLSEADSFQDIVRRMKSYIRENEIEEGQWVTGTNYDHNFLAEKCHPDKYVLDEISTVHPIVIVHASSHMGVANSLGLRMQGLDGDGKGGIPDPEGGRYGRVGDMGGGTGQSGELNGYMEENAFIQFRNAMPMPDIGIIMELFKRAQEVYASYGITTVQEGMVTEPLFRLLQYAEQKQILYLDLVGYIDLENCGELVEEHPEYRGEYRNHFKIGGYKIFLDGSPQGRTAWMKEPYLNEEESGRDGTGVLVSEMAGEEDGCGSTADGYCGYSIKDDDQLYNLILTSLQNGQQLLAHCNGDAAAEQYITQFEKVKNDYPEYDMKRPVMIHAQLVQRKQLERMRAIPMTPSFFTAHTYYWGDIHIQNFGMNRAENISPAGTAVRLGLPFTFHQDSPVLMPDVFRTIWCAAQRVTKNGVELSQEERVSVYEALKAVTIYGAHQYFEENEKGTIEEGKSADLVILDQNPLAVPVDEVKDVRVVETIKEGKVVFRREDIER